MPGELEGLASDQKQEVEEEQQQQQKDEEETGSNWLA